MPEFVHKRVSGASRAGVERVPNRPLASPGSGAADALLHAALNASPGVQAIAQLRSALNRGPRAPLLAAAPNLQAMPGAPIQLASAGRDRARLNAARRNRNLFLRLLMMVIAGNIANGAYALEDVDDLLEEPDRVALADEVRVREQLRAERRAQGQEQRDRQRDERRRQRGNRR
jgi:hypothetical protein